MFSDIEIVGLNLFLGVLDGSGNLCMFDGESLLHPHSGLNLLFQIRYEDTHEVIFQRQEES